MELLFVYGTLADAVVQLGLIGRVVPHIDDVLEGYGRSNVVIDEVSYSIAVEKNDSRIEGAVLELSDLELAVFDEYETDAYTRKKVCLKSGTHAWVYRAC